MKYNFSELINEVTKISHVEGVDDSILDTLKLKTIELLSAYSMANGKDKDLQRFSILNEPDFGAYFSIDKNTEKVRLVFRQEANFTMHYYFSSAEEMINGINHIFGYKLKNNENSNKRK